MRPYSAGTEYSWSDVTLLLRQWRGVERMGRKGGYGWGKGGMVGRGQGWRGREGVCGRGDKKSVKERSGGGGGWGRFEGRSKNG